MNIEDDLELRDMKLRERVIQNTKLVEILALKGFNIDINASKRFSADSYMIVLNKGGGKRKQKIVYYYRGDSD